jgi:hypothetical protein
MLQKIEVYQSRKSSASERIQFRSKPAVRGAPLINSRELALNECPNRQAAL